MREELAPRGFWGRVQGVGLIGWVNTRPVVGGTPSAHSADAREARFIGEFCLKRNFLSHAAIARKFYRESLAMNNMNAFFSLSHRWMKGGNLQLLRRLHDFPHI